MPCAERASLRTWRSSECGGTYVVLDGSRSMTGNVLVSGGRLSSRVSKAAKTHYVVADLPGGAKFERNVLIGPAYALLATQAAGSGETAPGTAREQMTIRQNVFDGLGDTSQAIRLNVGAQERLLADLQPDHAYGAAGVSAAAHFAGVFHRSYPAQDRN